MYWQRGPALFSPRPVNASIAIAFCPKEGTREALKNQIQTCPIATDGPSESLCLYTSVIPEQASALLGPGL